MDYLRKRRGVLDAVCISGGEPTLMPDLKEKIIAIRELGYAIKLDSNGCNPNVLKDLVDANLLDYIAMDIKNCKTKYHFTAGVHVDMEAIEESVRFIQACGVRYEFRTTMMKEFHNAEDFARIGEWIQGAERYFLQRYIDSEYCIQHHFHEVPLEEAKRYCDILRPFVPNVALRGYEE